MKKRSSIWLVTVLAVLCTGTAFVTLRAAEQKTVQKADQKADQTPAGSPAPAQPASTRPSKPPPSAPEESATIHDDPTVAPDPQESADNNVSFPVDI